MIFSIAILLTPHVLEMQMQKVKVAFGLLRFGDNRCYGDQTCDDLNHDASVEDVVLQRFN